MYSSFTASYLNLYENFLPDTMNITPSSHTLLFVNIFGIKSLFLFNNTSFIALIHFIRQVFPELLGP